MKTICYLQVEPDFYGWDPDRLRAAHVMRVTQKFPRQPIPGCLVVKLTLDIANEAFLPLRPEADITIPAEHTKAVTVTTEPLEIAV